MEDLRLLEIEEKQPQSMGVQGAILAVVISLVLLFVGLLIVSKVRNKMDTSDFTTTQNETLDDLDTTAKDSFGMAGLALFALPVVVLLGVIIALAR